MGEGDPDVSRPGGSDDEESLICSSEKDVGATARGEYDKKRNSTRKSSGELDVNRRVDFRVRVVFKWLTTRGAGGVLLIKFGEPVYWVNVLGGGI